MPLPKGFSQFLWGWECFLLQTKFLAVGTPLGHLSMKTFFRLKLSFWPKIRKRESSGGGGGRGGMPTLSEQKIDLFF